MGKRAVFNRVTEREPLPDEAWYLTTTWRGGHDKRPIRLENIYADRKDAEAEKRRIESGEHGFGSGFSGYGPVTIKRLRAALATPEEEKK